MGAINCQLNLDILMEDKAKIYGVEVEVRDINDNVPYFLEGELEIKMSESTGNWGAVSPLLRLGSGYLEELFPESYRPVVILTYPWTCIAERMVINSQNWCRSTP